MVSERKRCAPPSAVLLTPNQVVAVQLEEARADKRWTQMQTVQGLRRAGLRWSRAAYAMAVGSAKGKRPARFDADQLVAFARTFGIPVWQFLVPPIDWHGKRVRVRASKESRSEALDVGAMFDIARGPTSPPPSNEKERIQQEQEVRRIVELVVQFMYDHNLFVKPPPGINPLNLPPEVLVDLRRVSAPVYKKHGIKFESTEAPNPSRAQLQMVAGDLISISKAEKENH